MTSLSKTPRQPTPPGRAERRWIRLHPAIIALGGLASAALAVGAKRAIERRRRQFSCEPPREGPPDPPRQPSGRFTRRIVANADEDTIEDLRSAMSGLAAGPR